ncbi:P-loop containing nucleoside triphosphate hydrolase protein [Ceratobasidium sp. AG-I]|nr:P-loop containing nucleoside triphosphate hydrolase protein [Ceratobasidium sp. AG-I]
MKTRVVLIGIGGASCAGKTTLAAKLCSALPGCSILHQDDFWTAPEDIPIRPEYNLPNAEEAEFAIEWPRFRAAVAQFKASTSSLGDTSNSEDTEPESDSDIDKPSSSFGSLSNKTITEWRDRFQQVEKEWLENNVKIVWKIVEGFLLFYDPEVVEHLDVQIFLRSPRHVLQQRRRNRTYTYPNVETWVDSPSYYWDKIAYPGYVRAHAHLFQGGDVDSENLSQRARASGLVVLDGQGTKQNLSFEDLFRTTASTVLLKSQPPKRRYLISSEEGFGRGHN